MALWLKRVLIFLGFLVLWGAIAAWYFTPTWAPQLLAALIARTGGRATAIAGVSLGLSSIEVELAEIQWEVPSHSALTCVLRNLRLDGNPAGLRNGRAARAQVDELRLTYLTPASTESRDGVDLWQIFTQLRLPIDSVSIKRLIINSASPTRSVTGQLALELNDSSLVISQGSTVTFLNAAVSPPELKLALLSDLDLSISSARDSILIKPLRFGVGKLLLPQEMTVDEGTISLSEISITPAGLRAKYDAKGQLELKTPPMPRTPATVRGSLSLAPAATLPTISARISVPKLELGFPIASLDASLTFRPIAPSKISVTSISANFLGGTVRVDPFAFDSHAKKTNINAHLEGIRLDTLLDLYPESLVSATGVLDGILPIVIDASGLTISAGSLAARQPGGTIKGDLSAWVLAHPGNAGIALAARAFRDLRYHQLTSSVSYGRDGDLELQLAVKGKNPDLNEGQPLNVNITIGENVPSLLKTIDLIKNGPQKFTNH